MGFKLVPISTDECVIEVTAGGSDDAEFLQCVKQALQALRLTIRVDVSHNPQVLSHVLPAILKLQNVLSHHQKSVIIRGLPATTPATFLQKLKFLGLRLEEQVVKPVSMPSEMASQSVIGKTGVGAAPGEHPILPPMDDIEIKFRQLRDSLKEVLRRKEYLTKEKQSYIERIQQLSGQGHSSQIDQKLLVRVTEQEMELARLRKTRAQYMTDLTQAQERKKKLEEEAALLIKSVEGDSKKKKESLEKKIQELQKNREKTKADFKKRSDARKHQIAQLSAKDKGGG